MEITLNSRYMITSLFDKLLSLIMHLLKLCLYQPDIPQNTGTIMRTAACLGLKIELIEPLGFVLDGKRMRRSGMDYIDHVELVRYASWDRFNHHRQSETGSRLILLTTKAAVPYTQFNFKRGDRLLLGQESVGVPDSVHDAADARIIIPMKPGMRSLNIAQSAAMVTGEALRQLNAFPQP